jgi:membrane-bound lytic murein transglycosylase F
MIRSKRKWHPSLLVLVVFGLFWVFFALVQSIQTYSRSVGDFPLIVRSGALRVCGEDDLFSHYVDEKGEHGFQYEMIQTFAQRHNLKLQFIVENSLDKRLEMLRNERCDLLVGPLPITSDFQKEVLFTQPYMESRMVLVQRKNSKLQPGEVVRNMIDFGGKHIYSNGNKAQTDRLHHLASEISDTIHIRRIRNASNERLISLVASGLIDYAVCDMYVAKSFQKRYTSIDVETPIGFNQFQAWAVKPDRVILLDSLNAFIQDFCNSYEFEILKSNYQIP